MNKRSLYLIFCAVALGAAYVYFFKADWFESKKIQIKYRNFPVHGHHASEKFILSFFLDPPHKLASIKVVSAADAQTNKYPHALWHLVAKTNAILTQEFDYGARVTGMEPEVPQAVAEPLEPGQPYVLIVEDDAKLRGEITFNSKAPAAKPN